MKKDVYDAYVSLVKREDQLVEKRMGWMLTFNGFLFTSLAFITGKGGNSDIQDPLLTLRYGLPVLGIVTSLVTLWGVLAAHESLRRLRTAYESVMRKSAFREFPSPFERQSKFPIWLGPSTVLPISLLICWTYVLIELGFMKYLHKFFGRL